MESILLIRLYENFYFAKHVFISWNYLPPLSGVCLVLYPDCKLWDEALVYTSVSIIGKLETIIEISFLIPFLLGLSVYLAFRTTK